MALIACAAAAAAQGRPLSRWVLGDVFPNTLATTGGIILLALLVQSRSPAETHPPAPGAAPHRSWPVRARGGERR